MSIEAAIAQLNTAIQVYNDEQQIKKEALLSSLDLLNQLLTKLRKKLSEEQTFLPVLTEAERKIKNSIGTYIDAGAQGSFSLSLNFSPITTWCRNKTKIGRLRTALITSAFGSAGLALLIAAITCLIIGSVVLSAGISIAVLGAACLIGACVYAYKHRYSLVEPQEVRQLTIAGVLANQALCVFNGESPAPAPAPTPTPTPTTATAPATNHSSSLMTMPVSLLQPSSEPPYGQPVTAITPLGDSKVTPPGVVMATVAEAAPAEPVLAYPESASSVFVPSFARLFAPVVAAQPGRSDDEAVISPEELFLATMLAASMMPFPRGRR